jgi:bleomycin hydrolase
MKSITTSDLEQFYTSYHCPGNKRVEKQATKKGIGQFTLDKHILRENPAFFNLVLPTYHFYNQHDSGRCWCFSSLNLIEGNIARNLNITPRQLALSANYLTFFDKLEKTNYLYNYIIEKDCSLEKLCETVFGPEDPLVEGSFFVNFVNLVYKYGLVPASAMPENKNTDNSRDYLIDLWHEKARADALELFKLKTEASEQKLYQIKKQKLGEMYTLLSKISGEPPRVFSYRYSDRSGRRQILKNFTPAQFRDKFLTLDLRKFRSLRSDPTHKYYTSQVVKKAYSDNPFRPEIEYFNVTKSDMKRLAISQLKSGLPVKISIRTNLFKDRREKVLDTRLHNYEKLGVKLADYETGVATKLISSQHAMVITGVQIENGQPVRWKVENTHTPNQFYVMNDNFFDMYVVEVGIYLDFFDFDLK